MPIESTAAPVRGRRVLIPLEVPTPAPRPASGRPVDGLPGHGRATVVRLKGETMGTEWRVAVVTGDGATDRLRDGIQAVVDDVVRQMSSWDDGSDLSRFNRAPAGSRVRLPAGLFHVLSVGCAVARASGQAFDPTAGALVDLWGFGRGSAFRTAGFQAPDEAAVTAALACRGADRLDLDPADGSARQPGGIRLDLSGIAKGYGVDRVSQWLAREGFDDHLVDIGGELRGSGLKPDGQPWWVDLEMPASGPDRIETPALHAGRIETAAPDGPEETRIALLDLSIATSGDTRRHFVDRGRFYSHTLDPRRGRPVDPSVAAVTVLHRDCIMADALATALTVLGPVDGLALAVRDGLAARFLLRRRTGPDRPDTAASALREVASPAWQAMAA